MHQGFVNIRFVRRAAEGRAVQRLAGGVVGATFGLVIGLAEGLILGLPLGAALGRYAGTDLSGHRRP